MMQRVKLTYDLDTAVSRNRGRFLAKEDTKCNRASRSRQVSARGEHSPREIPRAILRSNFAGVDRRVNHTPPRATAFRVLKLRRARPCHSVCGFSLGRHADRRYLRSTMILDEDLYPPRHKTVIKLRYVASSLVCKKKTVRSRGSILSPLYRSLVEKSLCSFSHAKVSHAIVSRSRSVHPRRSARRFDDSQLARLINHRVWQLDHCFPGGPLMEPPCRDDGIHLKRKNSFVPPRA